MTPSPLRGQARRTFLLTLAATTLLAGCATRPSQVQRPGAVQANKVAVLVPLSGEDGAVGKSIADAARLALFDSGAKNVELTIYDTESGGAASAASRAIREGNRLILGPLLAEQVRAAAPVAQRARVPVIAFSNDVSAAAAGVYILGFAPSQAVERVVGQAARSGARRFAGLVPNNVYGQRAAQALVAAVQRQGGQVVGVETYASAEEARAAARRLNGRSFDAVLLADGGRVAMQIGPAVKSGPRILGTELWAGGPNLGQSARLRGSWYAAPSDARWGQFVQRYQARYGRQPVRIATLGYDSVLLTVRAARNWPVGRRFPEPVLREAEGFAGVDGIFRFDRSNVAQRAFEVRSVTAGGTTIVSPAPSSFN